MPHALLVQGSEGVGALEFARELASALLCESPGESRLACRCCAACGWLAQGNHPDFREVQPEALQAVAESADEGTEAQALPKVEDSKAAKSEKKSLYITIDQVRALAGLVTLSSHRAGKRVVIIHPAESMNPAAANALLKTLEEPAAGTVIILVANQPARLLATVRSRCQVVALPVPSQAEATAWLREQGHANPGNLLAQAGGMPLLALEFADSAYQEERQRFLAALAEPSRPDWIQTAANHEKNDLNWVVNWLHTWCCDLILLAQGAKPRYNLDHAATLAKLAERAPVIALHRYESGLRQARRTLAHPLNPRLLLEQLLISYGQAVHP